MFLGFSGSCRIWYCATYTGRLGRRPCRALVEKYAPVVVTGGDPNAMLFRKPTLSSMPSALDFLRRNRVVNGQVQDVSSNEFLVTFSSRQYY